MTVQENMTIDQKWVGWLLGKGGMVCHEIEVSTGAQVRIDQATKSLGYSTVQISGPHLAVQGAKVRVYEILDKVGARPGLNTTAQFSIEQRWVGALVGARGAQIREIEASCGAKVSIQQHTKEMGYSIVQVTGTENQIALATELINNKLATYEKQSL